ncbi:hypothetical protein CJ178_30380 [Rhodococcus sp. ACPA4]|nr:hypothetical protein CJ178_30380 [Rhodococcus sp. ACPA4]
MPTRHRHTLAQGYATPTDGGDSDRKASNKPGTNRTHAAEHFTKPLSVDTGCTECPDARMDD